MINKAWEYKGVVVFPAPINGSGIRWTASARVGAQLRSDTKSEMRALITETVSNTKKGG